jgi:uncharacterized protein (TIGR00290 family)
MVTQPPDPGEPLAGRPIACSWSGGKDSCLALYRATQAGGVPTALVTMFDASGERSRSHGLRAEVLAGQAERLGLELTVGRAGWSDYEARFKEQLVGLRGRGIVDVVFGDIDLQDHRDWEERVCGEVGLTAHLPLWHEDRRSILDRFWAAGFACRIVAVEAAKLGAEFLGVELTPEVADQLEARGVDACGENGEFHTVVVDGPLFAVPLVLWPGRQVLRRGYLALDFVV